MATAPKKTAAETAADNTKAPARAHRATYAKDKRKGGYMVRVEGPHSNMFVGKSVPVTMKDGTEQTEELTGLVWSGKDQDSGKPVTLYTFKPKPKEDIDVTF